MSVCVAVWFLLIPLFFCLSPWLPFVDIDSLSSLFHSQCLSLVSFESRYRNVYEALLCGRRLPEGDLKSAFVKGGLIHLMVVSGAHLLFLEAAWRKIPLPPKVKTPSLVFLLVVYALAARLHPPIMRALFAFFLFRLSQSCKLFWSSNMRVHISGSLCLIYRPAWVYSSSLPLSWLASLAQNHSSSLKRAFMSYLFILPIISRWQDLPPLTVIVNWLLAPLIGSLLFPMSFFGALFSPLRVVCDWLWGLVFLFLQAFKGLPRSSPLQEWSLPSEWTWQYLALIFLLVHTVEAYRRQALFGSGGPSKGL